MNCQMFEYGYNFYTLSFLFIWVITEGFIPENEAFGFNLFRQFSRICFIHPLAELN